MNRGDLFRHRGEKQQRIGDLFRAITGKRKPPRIAGGIRTRTVSHLKAVPLPVGLPRRNVRQEGVAPSRRRL